MFSSALRSVLRCRPFNKRYYFPVTFSRFGDRDEISSWLWRDMDGCVTVPSGRAYGRSVRRWIWGIRWCAENLSEYLFPPFAIDPGEFTVSSSLFKWSGETRGIAVGSVVSHQLDW